MKRYVVEVTHTPNSLNDMYPRGYKKSFIRKGDLVVKAEDFYRAPAFWSKYFYTSKKRAERGMKTIQENTEEEYWDSSFKVVEIEVSDCNHITRRIRGPIMSYTGGIVQSHWYL